MSKKTKENNNYNKSDKYILKKKEIKEKGENEMDNG